jgi:hypothetical protein
MPRRFNLKDSHGNLHFIEAEIIEFDENGAVTFLSDDNADALIACFAPGAWLAVFTIADQAQPLSGPPAPPSNG